MVLDVNEANNATKFHHSSNNCIIWLLEGSDFERRRVEDDVLRWISATNPASNHEAA